MLLQRYPLTRFKKLLESRTVCNLLQPNTKHSFYDNYEAVLFFAQYLRKRQLIAKTDSSKWNDCTDNAPMGMYFTVSAPTVSNFLTFNFKEWWKKHRRNYMEFNEKKEYEKHIRLGSDIAAAKFVVEFGGKVKFKHHNEWIDRTNKNTISKLVEYDDSYILEEIYLNGYELRYEHLKFISNLYSLKSLSFRGCPTVNDWTLDKISAEYPKLEYLDVSECSGVTERGLEALYKMPSLKRLVITNYVGTAAFDLTCLLLEDVNPYLTCQIQQPKYKSITEN